MNAQEHTALQTWLQGKGFAPFFGVGEKWESWENKTLVSGGIRIEICDYIAEIWCPKVHYFNILPTKEVQREVSALLKKRFDVHYVAPYLGISHIRVCAETATEAKEICRKDGVGSLNGKTIFPTEIGKVVAIDQG